MGFGRGAFGIGALTCTAILLAAEAALAGYEFSVSADSTNPYVNTAVPVNGARNLYLWLTCTDEGLSAFEANLTSTYSVFGFTPLNGVLNAGTATALLLGVPGCPQGMNINLKLGYWSVWDSGGHACLTPSSSGAINAVDCDTMSPHATTDPRVAGFASDGLVVCPTGTNGCSGEPPIVLEGSSYYIGYNDRRPEVLMVGSRAYIENQPDDGLVVGQVEFYTGIDTLVPPDADDQLPKWIQVGWLRRPGHPDEAYAEYPPNRPNIDIVLWTPVPDYAEYKIERQANGETHCVVGSSLLQIVSFANAGYYKYCKAEFCAESHNAADRIPASAADPLRIECCQIQIRNAFGTPWALAQLSRGTPQAGLLMPNSAKSEPSWPVCLTAEGWAPAPAFDLYRTP